MKVSWIVGAAVVMVTFMPTYGFMLQSMSTIARMPRANMVRSSWDGIKLQSNWPSSRTASQRCMLKLSATTETHGIVTFVAENGELAVEETVEIFYMPPVGMFKNPDALLYCGGFNGWDGEEDPMTIPMMPTDDGRFRVSLSVPNFAKSILAVGQPSEQSANKVLQQQYFISFLNILVNSHAIDCLPTKSKSGVFALNAILTICCDDVGFDQAPKQLLCDPMPICDYCPVNIIAFVVNDEDPKHNKSHSRLKPIPCCDAPSDHVLGAATLHPNM